MRARETEEEEEEEEEEEGELVTGCWTPSSSLTLGQTKTRQKQTKGTPPPVSPRKRRKVIRSTNREPFH